MTEALFSLKIPMSFSRDGGKQAVQSLLMTTATHDIVAKLWNLCNILKDGGITYYQYVIELTYLLFLKMAKETQS